jgi:integrase
MGWLTNNNRKARRDRAFTLIDEDVRYLIRQINELPNYVSQTLTSYNKELDTQLKLRDKALIAMAWIFFKRGGEILQLKRKDIYLTKTEESIREISVTFTIFKKQRHFKICPRALNLENVEIVKEGENPRVTRSKTTSNEFVKHILSWIEEHDRLTSNNESILFPPLRVVFTSTYFDFTKPMTIQNFDTILKRLDVDMTSCLFRYGGAEKYLRAGYTPFEMKEIGSWESSYMPEIYAQRKGITPTIRKWSDDAR